MRNSKLIAEKKEREILRLKKLTPEERLREHVRHNALIKKIFFAGLSSNLLRPGRDRHTTHNQEEKTVKFNYET